MKTMKRISGLLLALTLVLALAVPAFATATGCIIIQPNGTNTAVTDRTFIAYRILNAELAADGTTPIYTLLSGQDSFYKALFPSFDITWTADAKRNYVLDQIRDKDTAAEIEAFAKLVISTIGTNTYGIPSVTIDNSNNDGSNNLKVDVPYGYYVINDVTSTLTDQQRPSAVMINTTTPCAQITIKADTPDINKAIVENGSDVTSNEASIGDTVNFKLTTKIPDMTGYIRYFYNITDTLSPGLTLDDATDAGFTVTLDGTALTRVAAGDTTTANAYEVEKNLNDNGTSLDPSDDYWEFTIVFRNFIQYKDYIKTTGKAGAIVVTYGAVVNEYASYGSVPNENTVKLIFCNNPSNTGTGDKPDEEEPYGVTTEKKTYTYVTKITLLKVDSKDTTKTLAGAEFQIKGTSNKMAHVIGAEFQAVTAPATGDYWLLKDGTYTKTGPSTGTESLYVSTTQKYNLVTIDEVVADAISDVNVVGWTDANGNLTFAGLGAGTYTITELIAPDGYNLLLNPIHITVAWDSTTHAWSYTSSDIASGALARQEDQTLKLTIEDSKGGELPSTGGMGTTLFTIGGLILMAGAALVLVIRRKGVKSGK